VAIRLAEPVLTVEHHPGTLRVASLWRDPLPGRRPEARRAKERTLQPSQLEAAFADYGAPEGLMRVP